MNFPVRNSYVIQPLFGVICLDTPYTPHLSPIPTSFVNNSLFQSVWTILQRGGLKKNLEENIKQMGRIGGEGIKLHNWKCIPSATCTTQRWKGSLLCAFSWHQVGNFALAWARGQGHITSKGEYGGAGSVKWHPEHSLMFLGVNQNEFSMESSHLCLFFHKLLFVKWYHLQ